MMMISYPHFPFVILVNFIIMNKLGQRFYTFSYKLCSVLLGAQLRRHTINTLGEENVDLCFALLISGFLSLD